MTRPNYWGPHFRTVSTPLSDHYKPTTFGMRVCQAVMWALFLGLVIGAVAT